MNRNATLVTALVAAAGLLLAWLLLRPPTDASSPDSGPPTETRRDVTRFPADASQEAERPQTAAEARAHEGLPAPLDPSEEGSFALARAAGQGVVRCSLDGRLPSQFEKMLWKESAVRDGGFTLLVDPSTERGVPKTIGFAGQGEGLMVTYTDAFVGQLGTCKAEILATGEADPAPEPLEEAEVAEDADDAEDQEADDLAELDAMLDGRLEEILTASIENAERALDEQDRKVDPLQVALEDPGLSDGARRWLEERLAQREHVSTQTAEAVQDLLNDLQ